MAFRTVILGAIAYLATSTTAAHAQELPDGPGKEEFVAHCKICHDLERSTHRRLSFDQWTQKINAMRGFGAEGTQEDFDKIADYLATNFGDTAPAPPPPTAAP